MEKKKKELHNNNCDTQNVQFSILINEVWIPPDKVVEREGERETKGEWAAATEKRTEISFYRRQLKRFLFIELLRAV